MADESTATADYMPPFNGIGVSSLMVDLVTAVSNASSVKVNVDPTAGATVAQIVNLQEQIDDVKSFVGYESSDVYGVEIDFLIGGLPELQEQKILPLELILISSIRGAVERDVS